MKQPGVFLEKWGHYLLAALCAGVIVFSAFWARSLPVNIHENAPAAADQSQRLADTRQKAEETVYFRPAEGAILRSFSEEPVYDEALGLWAMHPALDFQTTEDEKIFAMITGRVKLGSEGLEIYGADEISVLYRGLSKVLAADGQQVKAGDSIGLAGGSVPMESGQPHICIRYMQQGRPVDFSEWIH